MDKSTQEEMRRMMDEILRIRYYDLNWEHELCIALLGMAEQEEDDYGIAFACTYLSDCYIGQGDNAQAGLLLQRARDMSLLGGYQDLLPRIYNLLGIFYAAIADDQSAMGYYQDGLDLPEIDRFPIIKGTILNNIAHIFSSYRASGEAKRYYLRALDAVGTNPPDSVEASYLMFRLWVNLGEVYCALGELDECRRCLACAERVPSYDDYTKIYLLCRGWSIYYAAVGDSEGLKVRARTLLDTALPVGVERYLIYEALSACCEGNIRAGNRACAQELLRQLWELDLVNELGRRKQAHRLRVRCCEAFGTEEERYEAYRDFYRATQQDEDTSDQMRVSGILATVNLRQAVMEKECAVREKDALKDEAHLDELTRLYNRRYFNKLTSKAVADPNLQALGFIMVDVDYFKEYNDTYGHRTGDEALKQVAALLLGHAGEHILPARYGGDEFVCLCLDTEDGEIESYIQAVRAALAELNIPHRESRCASRLTLSLGYANSSGCGAIRPGALLDAADKALYRAKEAGRNGWAK